ncbi:1067_t:CDS:10 [Diversispora eburnea]|uniref:RNA helicase n=1 Tax=Diversispora eburnea TaxID=1213867 RepID=A0A9N9AG32_9GLOM|nr:1067_t:CDS:10 [Diversispora eburnea]
MKNKLKKQNKRGFSSIEDDNYNTTNTTEKLKINKKATNINIKPKKNSGSNAFNNLQTFRTRLPIWKEQKNLIETVKNNETIIIIGEMGSGKTITQPRRVAAISLATRVAKEFGSKLGREIGYSVRFDEMTSNSTIIKYLTDGMLLRELLSDPLLLNYSIVILDEAHERTMRTDILFGMMKRAQEIRRSKMKPLKIIIMSATLNSEKFANYFNTAAILKISGRQFPVNIIYCMEPKSDYLDTAFTSILQIHIEQPAGDILVFLPGQEDIETLEKLIFEHSSAIPPEKPKIITCLLFAALPTEQQTKVFDPAPPGTRKVILSTNIAETSITIENISKNSADQRMGRAGREGPGFCYRLYTEEEYDKMEKETDPEIKRCNIASIILLLKALGIDNVFEFDYLDAPSRNLIKRAMEQLFILNALDNQGKIKDLGKRMAEFPLEPTFSRVLIASQSMGCIKEAIDIVSLLSVDSIFFTPQDQRENAMDMKKKFISPLGDLITYLNVLKSYEAHKGEVDWCGRNYINRRNMKHVIKVRKQLNQLCDRMNMSPTNSCGDDYEIILKCLLFGFFRQSAILQPDNNYKVIVSNQNVNIHPSSTLFNKKIEVVMYAELVLTSKPYIKNVSAIQSRPDPFGI